MTNEKDIGKGAYDGFGADWQASNLTPDEARRATDWVEAKIDKRALLTSKERKEDVRDIMWQLEKDGEILVHRVGDHNDPVIAKTLYGWDKKIPTNNLPFYLVKTVGNLPGIYCKFFPPVCEDITSPDPIKQTCS